MGEGKGLEVAVVVGLAGVGKMTSAVASAGVGERGVDVVGSTGVACSLTWVAVSDWLLHPTRVMMASAAALIKGSQYLEIMVLSPSQEHGLA
jgi:hypothetical protein